MANLAAMKAAQTEYEMNKKLYEEREKNEELKRETERFKFHSTEAQTIKFNAEMEKVATEKSKLDQEKLRASLVRKANDDLLQATYETRINEAKISPPEKIEEWENEIKAQGANLQALYFQKTKNELLAKGQKTLMELSSVTAANSALELDVTNRLETLTNLINNLTDQVNSLQQRINNQSNETNEMRVAQIQQLSALQVQIAQLQLEKQNMEIFANQRNVQ
jgi:hypothetical protein